MMKLGFAIPALFFRTGITVLENLRTGIPVPEQKYEKTFFSSKNPRTYLL
jgi:hypothetical protein